MMCMIIILILFNKKLKIRMCNWKIIREGRHDVNKNYNIKLFINLLKQLKIYYYIGFGTELGAVRDGGYIKGDNDFDIIIPISKNYWLFKCNEQAIFPPTKCWIRSHPNAKICNKTKFLYLKILRDYIFKITSQRLYFKLLILIVGL